MHMVREACNNFMQGIVLLTELWLQIIQGLMDEINPPEKEDKS